MSGTAARLLGFVTIPGREPATIGPATSEQGVSER
jgi:hypothetical protein